MERKQATEADIERALTAVREGLRKRINKHGTGKFTSRAEALGTLVEEYHEAVDAQRSNNLEEFLDEMMDVCITCVWTEISLGADMYDRLKRKRIRSNTRVRGVKAAP